MLGEVGAPRCRGAHHVGNPGEMRTVLDRLAEDFDGSGDHGENVVEVVGDAAGELTDGFHLLRLPDLRLGGLDLLKTLDHGLGAAAQPDFLLERRIGLLKLNACRHHQDPRQQQQHSRGDPDRDQRQQAFGKALDAVGRHPQGEDRQQAGHSADRNEDRDCPEHAAKHQHQIAAASPREERQNERGSEQGAGDHDVGNGIQPDQFRLPQQARAMRDERRHVHKISNKGRHRPHRDPIRPPGRRFKSFRFPRAAQARRRPASVRTVISEPSKRAC